MEAQRIKSLRERASNSPEIVRFSSRILNEMLDEIEDVQARIDKAHRDAYAKGWDEGYDQCDRDTTGAG